MHDSQIDLTQKGETVYRDKVYFGVKPHALMDKTMHRNTKAHTLSTKEKRRNYAIMKVRSLIERPFAMIKRVFHNGHMMVTTIARVHAKNVISCFAFNMHQLRTLSRHTS